MKVLVSIKAKYCGYKGFDSGVKYIAYSSRTEEDCYGNEFKELLVKNKHNVPVWVDSDCFEEIK